MRDLTIKVTVDSAQAEAGLKRVDQGISGVEKAAGAAGKATDGLQLSMTKIAQAAGGYIAVEQSLENLTRFASSSFKAFTDQESAVKKLTTALQAQGQATPTVIAQYDALASQFQRTTVFGDDLINQMEALLVQVGNVMPAQMEAALTASTDLAAGLGVDLRTATMLVAKAAEGHTESLSRYGLAVDDARAKTDPLGAVLDAINQKFGGQAQAQLETYSGRVENMGNRWNDFQERVGDLIARALTPLLDLFDALPASMQTAVFAIGSVVGILAPLAGGIALIAQLFGVNLIPLLTGPLVAAWTGLASLLTGTILPLISTVLPMALRALAGLFSVPAGVVVAGILAVVAVWKNWDTIGPIVKNVYTAVKTWLVDKFAAVVTWIGEKVGQVTGFFRDMYDKVVGNSYVPDLIIRIGQEFGKLPTVMVAPARRATDSVSEAFRALGEFFKPGNLLNTAITGGMNLLMNAASALMQKGMEKLGQLAWEGLKKIGGFFKRLFGGPSADELAGREVVAAFEGHLADMLTETQKMEAGNDAWKQTVIAIRDQYLAMGRTEADALRDTERLWAASRDGAEAAKRVIEEIQQKFGQGITVPIVYEMGTPSPSAPALPMYHQGGVVDRLPRAHRGLAVDEVPIVALRGEGILNRGAMSRIGGAPGLHALNRGGASAGCSQEINVYLDGEVIYRNVKTREGRDLRTRRKVRAA